MFKFRTMFEGVGDRLGSLQTSRNDSRVTRIGRWLRRTSIDELPQLFNVLIGDMALVGPRAHPVGMCIDGEPYERVVEHYAARHRVKPGITGLAQISGNRGAVQDPEKAKSRFSFDLHYIQSWSLALDVKIMFDTILHLFRRDEAY
jgi:lipopolysaccharide/colanic/teichoic acid biosynthesis glycosyltransferase